MFVYDFPTLMVRLQPPAFLTCTQMVFLQEYSYRRPWTSLACVYKLSSLYSAIYCFISLLGVSFIGLFHVVQEVKLRSDYKEIILLKKKSRGRTADPLLLSLSCWGGPAWNWGSVDPRWGLWCLIVAAWTCLCLAPTAQGWVEGGEGRVPRFLEEGDPLFLHVSDRRALLSSRAENVFNIVHFLIVQHGAKSYLCLDFPSC